MPEDGSFDMDRFIARKPKTAREFLQQKKVRKLTKTMARIEKRKKRRKA